MRHKFLIFIILFISLSISCNVAVAVDTHEIVNLSQISDNITVDEGSTYQITEYVSGESLNSVKGYWINSGPDELDYINSTALKNAGITDLFVLTYKEDPEGTLKPFLDALSGSGIRIHAWVTCFKDQKGNWFDPDENPALMKDLINKITFIATNYNVDGIHLDYVRYPGTAYNHPNSTLTVTSFVQNIYNNVNGLNQQLIPGKPYIYLSAALMPECGTNAYYYGQDYGQLSNYLDLLIPMVYKGNYNQNTAWIGTTTQYIVQNANGKPVVIGIQTYRSDSNPVPIPVNELNADIKSGQDNGSSGYVLFKYGLLDSSFPGTPIYSKFTIEEIAAATKTVNDYVEANQKLPNNVIIGTKQINIPQFISLLVNSLLKVNSGDKTPIVLKNFRKPKNPSESIQSGNIYKTEYLDLAKKIKSPMEVGGVAPNYVDSSRGKIGYESIVYMYSRIMNFYYTKKTLPNYVSIKSWPVNTYLTVTNSDPAPNSIQISLTSPVTITFSDNILAGINYPGIYIKNTVSGSKVSISSKTINGNTLTITGTNPKKYNTKYQVYIPAGAVKDGSGNNLVTAYTYYFTTVAGTTDVTPPTIISTNPASNATGVSLTSSITIKFSENIVAGTNYSGIYIKNLSTGTVVSIASKSISGNTLTIKQTYSRLSKNNYQVYIPAGAVKDAAGNNLATAYTYTFTIV